jgi:hypothetical protein
MFMSSLDSAAKSARRPRDAARGRPTVGGDLAADANRLAAELERDLATGRSDRLSPETVQTLLAALCRTYSAQVDAGANFLPVPSQSAVTPTDVMVTASGLLRSANLAVFELGMWQSCTGR